ncbi:MAG: hypothetical protein H6Q33_898 [Deltaproteobacteria bacterium]|nr:hypothetical protein [Deltaproteobacteria bacterium]
MPLTAYTFDPALAQRFADFCFTLYRNDSNWIPPLRRRLLAQFRPDFTFHQAPGNAHQNFLATANGKAVGHITAMVNRRLCDNDGVAVGTVGFFECIDEPAVATDLLAAATDWLRAHQGLRRVWGPMQFDVWHGYRLMTRGFDTPIFFGEPYNRRYYPTQFAQNGFTVRKRWHSVELGGTVAIRQRTDRWEEDYTRALHDGYRFAPIDVRDLAHVRALHTAVEDSYRAFLGLTRLDFDEFRAIFAAYAEALDPRFAIGAWDSRGALGGFAISYPDYGQALRAMRGRDSLLAKLRFYLRARTARRAVFFMLGITAAESARRRGLGRALFYAGLRALLAAGFESIVVALLAEDSPAWPFLSDYQTQTRKEYALYEANFDA